MFIGYCGNTATDNGATGSIISDSSCQTTCAGDPTKKCGGANTLDLYMRDPVAVWESRGCYQDSGSSRVLQGAILSQATMTIDKCQSFCRLGGHSLAGLENGRECYCSSKLTKSGSAGLPLSASQCNVACAGKWSNHSTYGSVNHMCRQRCSNLRRCVSDKHVFLFWVKFGSAGRTSISLRSCRISDLRPVLTVF